MDATMRELIAAQRQRQRGMTRREAVTAPVIPEIAKAYQNDPRTQLAMRALDNGSSGAPVAQGKYAMADGVARMLGSLGGAMVNKKMMGQYSADEAKTIADQQSILQQTRPQAPVPQAPAPAMPQAPPNLAAAASALGAPPVLPQVTPTPGMPPQAAVPQTPAPIMPSRTGGAPLQGQRPFGSAAASVKPPSWRDAPIQEEIPDAPAPVARPERPKAVGATRSRLLDAAYATIENGNRYLFANGQEMYRAGTEEQTALDEKAAAREQAMIDAEYGTDRDIYANATSQDRGNTYEERRAAQGRNFTAREAFVGRDFQNDQGAIERAFQASEKAKDRAAARANAAMAASRSGGGKPLTFTAAEKLAKQAGLLDMAERLQYNFKPGHVGLWAGRADVDTNKVIGANKEMGAWWQDYDTWTGEVRHGLYGASLTDNERAAFDRTIVTPRMNAELAASNLEKQRAITAIALARQSRAAASVYGIESVYEAIGRDPTQLSTAPMPVAPTAKRTPTGNPLVDKYYMGSH